MIEDILAGGAKTLGIALPENAGALCDRYLSKLAEANRSFNLTAIASEGEAARLHILDSLGLLKSAEISGKRVVDVGTGGGLPGIPLKIARPDADVTLLDATEKKIAFLDGLTRELGIPCACVAGRAEELGHEESHREKYDFAVSRAVSRLPVLAELCLPLTRVGGRFLAMKAADSDGEIDEAKSAIENLGGKIDRVDEYTIPGTDILRRVVVVEKIAPTDARYPRRWAAINRRPL